MEKKNCKNHFQVDYRSNLKLQTTKLLEKATVSSRPWKSWAGC